MNKKVWITNDIQDKLINKDDVIPEGWKRGRKEFSKETKQKISNKRKGKIHIHKDNISKLIEEQELRYYLEQGFELGRAQYSDEARNNIIVSRKKFFEDNPHWSNSTTWKKGNAAWNKGVPMSEASKEKLSRKRIGTHLSSEAKQQKVKHERETRALNAGSIENSYYIANEKKKQTLKVRKDLDPKFNEKVQEKSKNTCIQKYGCEYAAQSPEVQAKRERTNLEKYGVPIATKSDLIKEKIFDTKRKNNSFSKSQWENLFYVLLLSKFKSEDVIRQYVDKDRYPFNCDFYIKPLDMFIELNFYWTHGPHPFNPNNEEDINLLNYWKSRQAIRINSKGKESKNSFYTAVEVWTVRDVQKITIAKKNNLNYVLIYNKGELYDFIRRI